MSSWQIDMFSCYNNLQYAEIRNHIGLLCACTLLGSEAATVCLLKLERSEQSILSYNYTFLHIIISTFLLSLPLSISFVLSLPFSTSLLLPFPLWSYNTFSCLPSLLCICHPLSVPLMDQILHRFPTFKEAEIRQFVNGPDSFTPDSHYLVGETPEVCLLVYSIAH